MRFNYHPETDSLYIHLSEKAGVDAQEIAPDVVMDVDEDGRPVGFDIQNASLVVDTESLSPKSALQRAVLYFRRKGVLVKVRGRGAAGHLLHPRRVEHAK